MFDISKENLLKDFIKFPKKNLLIILLLLGFGGCGCNMVKEIDDVIELEKIQQSNSLLFYAKTLYRPRR